MKHKVLLVLGMAGSGKTVFCHRLYSWLCETHCAINKETGLNDKVFGVNLDPAAVATKMPLHYDIRDLLSIEELMEKKRLGPNGAILASLNMFIAHIDTFIAQMEETAPAFTIIDTPGQIEMFTTSVSGQILAQCLSSSPNTEVSLLYVVDGEKAQSPQCFVSNMAYAASIFYRFGIPMHIVVNKSDVQGVEIVEKWKQDFEALSDALLAENSITPTIKSIALWLEEFYSEFPVSLVSATTGMGKKGLLSALLSPKEDLNIQGAQNTPPSTSICTQPQTSENHPST
ncbi:GPN-loop GTPase [Nematocida sp. AWRm77]|nr:GPN-loop GTPase [Nematocida sp. AWRm77]